MWYCHLGKQLPSFAKWFPNLRRLKLGYVRMVRGFDHVTLPRVENLSILARKLNEFGVQNVTELLQANRQLQCLDIRDFGQEMSMNSFLDTIKQHSSITRLNVVIGSDVCPMNTNDVQRIIDEHPALIRLVLPYYQFALSDAIAVIRQLKFLNKFSIQMQQFADSVPTLVSKLDNKWECLQDKNSKFIWGQNFIQLLRDR